MAIGMMQVTKPPMGVGAPAPLPSGGIQGTATNYVQPGSQFSQQNIQRNAQQRVPFQGMYNGNPRGAANMPRMGNQNPFGFQGQGQAPAWSQQTNLGRYIPPTMSGMGGYNSNVWNNQGGYDYNLPGSYGSPLGQGQFAPMPQQFQQYMQQMSQFFPQQQQSMTGMYADEQEAPSYGPMAPDKRLRVDRGGGRGPQAPQFNAWDNPNDRGYNMAALRQMMGSGYF